MSSKLDKEFRKLPIDSFFNAEADHLSIAQKQVKLIHNSGDISASGDHFEVAVRNLFSNKLPEKYYISNGHIIDSELNSSPQLDLLIADNFKTPVLYKTLGETEYLTYESIYAYAEIKSSWNKKYIGEFIETRERIDKFLSRKTISPNYIEAGGKGLELNIKTTNNKYKNPLFSFMLIGCSDNFKFSDLTQYYEETNWGFLPNVICFLDKGIIANINKSNLDQRNLKINLYPEFIEKKEDNDWVLLNFEKKRSAIGTLYYIILEHLNTTTLGNAEILKYMQQIFEIKTDNIDFINDFK